MQFYTLQQQQQQDYQQQKDDNDTYDMFAIYIDMDIDICNRNINKTALVKKKKRKIWNLHYFIIINIIKSIIYLHRIKHKYSLGNINEIDRI